MPNAERDAMIDALNDAVRQMQPLYIMILDPAYAARFDAVIQKCIAAIPEDRRGPYGRD